MNIGKVVSVVGPAIDIEFEPGQLPEIYNAIKIKSEDQDTVKSSVELNVTLEVAQHLGNNLVRAVAMSSTDGMVRGMKALDTGAPISIPVGRQTLGRLLNVIGETIDQKGPVETDTFYPIHRPPLRYLKPESRLLTCWRHMPRVVKSVSSAVQVLVKQFLSWSLSGTSLMSTVGFPCLPVLVSVPVKVMTSIMR